MKLVTLIFSAFFICIAAKSQNSFRQESNYYANNQLTQKKKRSTKALPFYKADKVPLAPKCKRSWNSDKQRKCTQSFIKRHIAQNFRKNLDFDQLYSGTLSLNVDFVIDKKGNVSNVNAYGGPEVFNNQAIKIIKRLPKFKPGKFRNKVVNVGYAMPIKFSMVN